MLQCGMNLRVNELSHSGKETKVRRFDHEGLHQLQNCSVTDEVLHWRNVLPLSLLLLRESSLTLKFTIGCDTAENTAKG